MEKNCKKQHFLLFSTKYFYSTLGIWYCYSSIPTVFVHNGFNFLDKFTILSRVKELTLYRMTKQTLDWFKLRQTVCRPRNNCELEFEVCFDKSIKHCGKRRKCWSPAFSPFLTMFSKKGFYPKIVKSLDCVVKS